MSMITTRLNGIYRLSSKDMCRKLNYTYTEIYFTLKILQAL